MSTYKIAMIGDSSTVSGFSAGGVMGFTSYESRDALEKLKELVLTNEYAIIFITETLAEPVLDEISKIETGAIPAIIIVPDHSGTRGIGFKKIKNAVEKAIGIDLLGKE